MNRGIEIITTRIHKFRRPDVAPAVPTTIVAGPDIAVATPANPNTAPAMTPVVEPVRTPARRHANKHQQRGIRGTFTEIALVGAVFVAGVEGGMLYSISQKPSIEGAGAAAASMAPATPNSNEAAGTPNPSAATASPDASAGIANNSTEINISANEIDKGIWGQNLDNWKSIKIDGITRGKVLTPEPTGRNSVVSTPDSVGQGFWYVKVPGKDQAIGLVIAPDLTLPVRGISIYPLAGEDRQAALQRAFDGQVELESRTQPNVCTLEITDSIQAILGNEQSVSQDMWQAEKLTPQQAAAKIGRDPWSQEPDNWKVVDGGFGVKLAERPDGLNSVVEMNGAIGLAYWEANVAGEHQAIAGTLGVGVIAPVRGVTVYSGVPAEQEDAATTNAFHKAVNLEIGTQPGVFVVKVSKSVCPAAEQIAPKASPTAKPEATPRTTEKPWYANDVARIGNKAETSLLPDGGLKVHVPNGRQISVTIDKGEKIYYWNGTKAVWAFGPTTVKTSDGTLYKGK